MIFPMNSDSPNTADLVPTKAEFQVGTYEDGSGPIATVSYDTTSKHTPTMVWVHGGDSGSDSWLAFDWQHADAICDAIKTAAAALKDHRKAQS